MMTGSFKIAALAAAAIGALAVTGCTTEPPSTSRTVIYSGDRGSDRMDRRHDNDRGRDHRSDRDRGHDRDYGRDRDRDRGHDRDKDRNRGHDRGSQTACTMEYAPVCARKGRDQRTFSNACQARAARYDVSHGGRC